MQNDFEDINFDIETAIDDEEDEDLEDMLDAIIDFITFKTKTKIKTSEILKIWKKDPKIDFTMELMAKPNGAYRYSEVTFKIGSNKFKCFIKEEESDLVLMRAFGTTAL